MRAATGVGPIDTMMMITAHAVITASVNTSTKKNSGAVVARSSGNGTMANTRKKSSARRAIVVQPITMIITAIERHGQRPQNGSFQLLGLLGEKRSPRKGHFFDVLDVRRVSTHEEIT